MLIMEASDHTLLAVWTYDEVDRLRGGELAGIDLRPWLASGKHTLVMTCLADQAALEAFVAAQGPVVDLTPGREN